MATSRDEIRVSVGESWARFGNDEVRSVATAIFSEFRDELHIRSVGMAADENEFVFHVEMRHPKLGAMSCSHKLSEYTPRHTVQLRGQLMLAVEAMRRDVAELLEEKGLA